jgi:hypothetical protein
MGRFSGGTASRWKSRSEINVRTLAAATVAITNSPCHQDRDSFRTISRTDTMRTGTHGQTLLTAKQMVAERTEKFLNPTQMRGASHRKQRIMKPTFPTLISPRRRKSFDGDKCRSRRSPVTDYNYHSMAFEGSSARHVSTRARSFWNITGDYYKNEARQDFWGEASLWAVLALTAFLPLISNAHAVMEFVRAISSY